MPWVWGTLTLENSETSGPYHLVWPRDLYHVATAQKVAGDGAAADRLLDFLWSVQKPDGSFWQNTEVDGTEHWTGQQLDETALPIVLSWWLNRRGATDWAHVRTAADYLVANGPDSDQERWENQSGWSPNTIATEIAGLICAADIARRNGDTARAKTYEATADTFQRNVRRGRRRPTARTARTPTTCASARTATRTTAARTTSATTTSTWSTSARSWTRASSASSCSAPRSSTTRRSATRSR